MSGRALRRGLAVALCASTLGYGLACSGRSEHDTLGDGTGAAGGAPGSTAGTSGGVSPGGTSSPSNAGRSAGRGGSTASGAGGESGVAASGESSGGRAVTAGGRAGNDGGRAGGGRNGDAGTPSTAGSSAGAAGDGAEAGAPPGPDRDVALWPMPNPVGAGLPNPASYDTTDPNVVQDLMTGLSWMRLADTGERAWSTTACDALVLGGHDDWRMPSAIELFSLTDWTQSIYPYFAPGIFPAWDSGFPEFWSTTRGYVGNTAWRVDFTDPGFAYALTDDLLPTICVRGGPTASITHYVIGDDTVHDNGTGLTWERNASEDLLPFDGATEYCASLALEGHDDWRVPGLGELATLVAWDHSTIELDLDTFPDSVVADFRFWSAGSWELDFFGAEIHRNDGGTARPRCVR